MPLRWKIWLSVFGIVTGLFGVAGYMLQRHAVESATLSLEEEVQAGFQAYESVLKARQEMIGSAALLLSSLPNVRAAFGTGDPATIRDSATELGSYLSPTLKESTFLIVADPRGNTIAVLSGTPSDLTRLRTDPENRLFTLSDNGVERLLLDPAGAPSALWQLTARSPTAVTLAGVFSEELTWLGTAAPLSRNTGRLARGVGPTYYQSDVVAGSSGGFGVSYTLLEAVIGGARFVPNYPALELSLETQAVNMGAKSARNCALPCYFVACFGADSPNTYKPCIEANVRGGAGRLTLTDPSGNPVFESPANGWVRIPLYTGQSTPLPPGRYTVSATVNGSTVTLPLTIQ